MSRTASFTALRLRLLLRDKPQAGPLVVATLVKVDAWATALQASGAILVLRARVHPMTCDAIQQLAEDLIAPGIGSEGELLLKSLQEAFIYSLDFATNLNATQITARLRRCLDRQSKAAFIQQFLSLYVFNDVWSYVGESFEARAITLPATDKEMDEVDRICQEAIVAAYEPADMLNESGAEALIRHIEQYLRGI
jgi:hypothetical protein